MTQTAGVLKNDERHLQERAEVRERVVHVVEYSRYPRRDRGEDRRVAYTQDRSKSGLGLDMPEGVLPGELLRITLRDIDGRDFVGVDHILWGNDYPHFEGCYPHSRENMRLAFSSVDPKEVRMMLGENAAKLYGFDLEALRPLAEKIGIDQALVSEPLDEIPDSTCPAFMITRYERARAARKGR